MVWRTIYLFCHIWAYFCLCLAKISTISTWKRDPHWFDWMPLLCSNLVPPRSTQYRPSRPICVALRLISTYFCLFMAPFDPYLGHFQSGKWAKLASLNVLSAVPTLFQPNPLNRWSHKALLVKMPIWAVFGPFWPWEGPNTKNARCTSCSRGQC